MVDSLMCVMEGCYLLGHEKEYANELRGSKS